jgi:hypothetical protein
LARAGTAWQSEKSDESWVGVMTSQAGAAESPDGADGGRLTTQRDKVAKLLRDPEGYFAESRRWARRKARADVQQELSEARNSRGRRSGWQDLGLT